MPEFTFIDCLMIVLGAAFILFATIADQQARLRVRESDRVWNKAMEAMARQIRESHNAR